MNPVVKEHTFPTGQKLQIVQGDITTEAVDAIVNAANSHLAHGAGVAGAIVRKGGPVVQQESDQWIREHGLVSHTEPAYTRAGNLPCRYIIHAVGPEWGEGDERAKLSCAVQGALQLAGRLGLVSLAVPAISAGIFGVPVPFAARVLLTSILDYLAADPDSSLKLIRLVLFDQGTVSVFLQAWEQDDHFNS